MPAKSGPTAVAGVPVEGGDEDILMPESSGPSSTAPHGSGPCGSGAGRASKANATEFRCFSPSFHGSGGVWRHIIRWVAAAPEPLGKRHAKNSGDDDEEDTKQPTKKYKKGSNVYNFYFN